MSNFKSVDRGTAYLLRPSVDAWLPADHLARFEVAQLLNRAEQADAREAKQPLDIPAQLSRRETRLAAIAEAKVAIERCAAERHAAEQMA